MNLCVIQVVKLKKFTFGNYNSDFSAHFTVRSLPDRVHITGGSFQGLVYDKDYVDDPKIRRIPDRSHFYGIIKL